MGTPTAIPPPPIMSAEDLNAYAIGMRNRGQLAVPTLTNGYVSIRDWLRAEFERCGYDIKSIASL